MKACARALLASVLVADLVVVVGLAGGAVSGLGVWADEAATESTGTLSDENAREGPLPQEAESLARLGRELAERLRELERREAELAELGRAEEVLRRAGIVPVPDGPDAGEDASSEVARTEAAQAHAAGPSAFDRLRRAYENMEPDTAAQALSALARRDREAVIALLAAWNPRVSGAILDALTRADAALAAELSYEVWKRSGKPVPELAKAGR